MCPEKLEKLIQQHGEAAKSYAKKAIQIGDTYIIPNFGFDPIMQNSHCSVPCELTAAPEWIFKRDMM